MRKIGVWLDDFRDPAKARGEHAWAIQDSGADEIVWVKNYDDFTKLVQELLDEAPLQERVLCALFFDNDLGDSLKREGHHAFNWFEEICHERDIAPVFLYTQSSNTPANEGMIRGFSALQRYWAL